MLVVLRRFLSQSSAEARPPRRWSREEPVTWPVTGLKLRTPNSARDLGPLLPLMLEKMEPENHALQTRHSGWLGQLSLDLLVAKEPQNPHSGSKLKFFDLPFQNTGKA